MAPWNVHRLHTHTRNQHRARCITYPAILMVSFLHRPHFPRPWPDLRDTNLRFLKHWVFDIYRSGNLHFCPPLRSHFWSSWARALPPGSGLPKQEQLLVPKGGCGLSWLPWLTSFFFTGLVCWHKSLQHLPFSISWSQFQCLLLLTTPSLLYNKIVLYYIQFLYIIIYI